MQIVLKSGEIVKIKKGQNIAFEKPLKRWFAIMGERQIRVRDIHVIRTTPKRRST